MTDQPSYPLSATPYGQRVATYFPAFAPAKTEEQIRVDHHRKVMTKGLRANLLVALQRAIEDDPSIPQAPGDCAWAPEACKINRQPHGPCLDHC